MKRKELNVTKNQLEELFINKQLKINEIAKIFNCSGRIIRRYFKLYNIKTRTSGEGLKIYYNNNKVWNKGTTKENNFSMRKASEHLKGKIPWNKNKKGVYSEKTRVSMGADKVGKPSWNKGLLGVNEHIINLANIRRGTKLTKEWANKIAKSHTGLKYKKWSSQSRKNLSVAKLALTNKEEIKAKRRVTLEKHLADGSIKPIMFNTKPELKLLNYYIENGYVEGKTIIKQYNCKNITMADFYLPKENTLIFVDGDYWHCNPLKYKPCYYHQNIHRFANDIWKKDKDINDSCKQLGFNVVRVWEMDINKFISSEV